MRRRLAARSAAAALGVLIAIVGPRVEIDTTMRTTDIPVDLDRWIAERESRFDDIIPNTNSIIVRDSASGTARSEWAVVYLHGFSATRQEMAPLADTVAARLNAHLYYARFSGHGRTGEALADVTVNDWINDANEAIEIGRRLGDRVVVIAGSTGASIATWLATRPEAADVDAWVLLSPNYGPANRFSEMLLWPWGEHIAMTLLGRERSWTPQNELHARYWTTRYPTRALLPMMGAVKLARDANLAAARAPVLVLYSPADQVVDPDRIESAFERFGSPLKRLEPIVSPSEPAAHVLAGDILAPDDTRPIADRITRFLDDVSAR